MFLTGSFFYVKKVFKDSLLLDILINSNCSDMMGIVLECFLFIVIHFKISV